MKKRCRVHEDELEAICDDIARDGLRTLVFAQKVITNEQAEKFLENYREANERLRGRKAAIDKVLKQLETDMEFLCVTGVEDRLQDDC